MIEEQEDTLGVTVNITDEYLKAMNSILEKLSLTGYEYFYPLNSCETCNMTLTYTEKNINICYDCKNDILKYRNIFACYEVAEGLLILFKDNKAIFLPIGSDEDYNFYLCYLSLKIKEKRFFHYHKKTEMNFPEDEDASQEKA